jgi:type 1 glutamine amidotransferase
MRRLAGLMIVSALAALGASPVLGQAARDAERTYVINERTERAIEAAAPDAPLVKPAAPRKVLVYGRVPTHPESVVCCFKAMEVLGRKTGAFEAVSSGDPAVFLPENLKQFDAVVMNNTHERWPMLPRDLDALSEAEQEAARRREPLLQKSLVDFVASGGGLVGIHGATAIRDDWPELPRMYGAHSMGHSSGALWVKPDEPDHPLVRFLGGESFPARDEFYVHRKPLTREPMTREDVRVLLSLDLSRMDDPGLRKDGDYAISWIRNYGKGRVFYCTLGHAAATYGNPAVMEHFLAGIQWAIGDLKADASPASATRREER